MVKDLFWERLYWDKAQKMGTKNLTIKQRNATEDDYSKVIYVLNAWWGGRNMVEMLPRLFFFHFSDTSYVIEDASNVVAFLIGFVSQAHPDKAYVHFIGVDPQYRSQGLGRQLYEQFFSEARTRRCRSVRCVTGTENTGSIAFHQRLGFEIEKSDSTINDTPAMRDYDGPGQHRVCFVKYL